MPPGHDAAVAPDVSDPDDGTVTIALCGRLDANAGVELLAALKAKLDAGANRVDVDLLRIDGWTPEGARALLRCRRMAGNLPGGLHYRTGGDGHGALLEAFALEDEEAGADGATGAAVGSDRI